MIIDDLFEASQSCPHCGGPMFSEMLMMEKKDACYYKVKASAKVWPSAYASGRLVQCRKKGADNYGNKNESQEQLDEKCWDGYEQQGMKNKSGRQVPNCVPAESVNEMDKSQTPPGRDGSNDSDAGKKEYTAKPTTAKKVTSDGEKILNKELNKKQAVAEEYELAGVGVAYELGRRAYKQGMTIRDNPYSATREARKNDEWAKGLERGKHDANDARHFRSSVREQGVAETDNSNFVGFMNKTLADKVDSPKADPIAGAPDFYRNAAVSTLDGRQGFKNALKFGLKALSRLDPETRQQLAAGSEQAVANYLTDVAQRSGQMGDGTFVEEDISEVQDYLSDVFHDPSINSWKDVLQQSQGMSEDQVNEKSVSQAQFRTMAAAAHNPKFAKKVGISRDVAKEFHSADKNSNYKKLPDRTTEGELDEGWKSALGAAAIAGTMAMGAGGAHARVSGDYVDNPEINRLTGQPKVTQQISPDAAKPGFSKEYLQSVVDGTHPRPLISKERAQELLQQQTTNEQGEQQKGADYRDPPEADYGADYQDMVSRVKKLAGLGPLKTVYDPARRVYRNVPTAVQPKK